MAFSTGSSPSVSAEINVTPLIDVLLVLVIVFMVIAPAASRGLASSIPEAGTAAAAASPIVLQIQGGESAQPTHYRIGAPNVAYAALQPRLEMLLANRHDRVVYLRADRSLSYRVVAEVVGLAHAAGATGVVLAADR